MKNKDVLWRTSARHVIAIGDMSDEHIFHASNFVRGAGYELGGRSPAEWEERFSKEIKRRRRKCPPPLVSVRVTTTTTLLRPRVL